MKKKAMIIKLIQQDLKHSQLLYGLKTIGLSTHLYQLSIINIVEEMMGINSASTSDQWNNVYFTFQEIARQYPVTESGDELKALAEECYSSLRKMLP